MAACVSLTGWMVPGALADEFVDRVNARYASVAAEDRSDQIVLPALAAMAEAPLGAETRRKAMLLVAGSPVWAAAARWAEGETQQAMLAAASAVTQETDPLRAMLFAQPYGIEALIEAGGDLTLIEAGLYTDLGDPPLLADARHGHLEALDRATCLVHVEATRLGADGQPMEACRVLADWMLFARQMADRPFFAESAWGLGVIAEMQERIRDVLYRDWRSGRPVATGAEIAALIARIDEFDGIMSLDRMQLPSADLDAAEQVMTLVIRSRGEVMEGLFAPTMARLASGERPLRLFSERARWRDAAVEHEGWFDTEEMLRGIRADFEYRWSRGWHDTAMKQPFEYAEAQSAARRYAVVVQSMPDLRELFDLRQLATTEGRGTRHALGMLAFVLDNGLFPRELAAIRPRYVDEISDDPFNPDRRFGRVPPLQYFVPMRDTAGRFGERESVRPHQITVLIPDSTNVAVRLRDDEFVLYSTGADGERQWADEAQNTVDAPSGRDYLLWPPVVSILREHLRQQMGR